MIGHLKALGFNLGNARTAIIPIIIGDQQKLLNMSREVHEAGIMVNSVFFPAVTKKQERLRLSLMATLSQEDLDYTLEVFAKLGRKYGLI
jgi:glycine C-acetyltransferase